jgi:hypothetical protein
MQVKKISLIEPSSYQEKLCDLFAKESVIERGRIYSAKGTGEPKKIEQYAYLGKMGEYAVFNTLLSSGKYKFISPPDVVIYAKEHRSHAADLVADGKKIHVKCCNATEWIATSWLFSTEDPLVDNPAEDDIVAFVALRPVGKKFECYFVKATELKGMYKKPVYAKTVAHAIYEKDLLNDKQ